MVEQLTGETCPNGHPVELSARFCSQCGALTAGWAPPPPVVAAQPAVPAPRRRFRLPQITEHRAVTSELPADVLVGELVAKLKNRKYARFERVDSNHIEGRLGSQLALRLKGGWIASPSDFPILVGVALQPMSSGTEVRIAVADGLGIGSKWGMRKKYEQSVAEVADALVAAVVGAQPLSTTNEAMARVPATPVADEATPCPNGHPAGPSVGYPPQVGAPTATWPPPVVVGQPAAPDPLSYPPVGYWSGSTQPSGPGKPGTNGLAVASMILGILWFFFIGSILAVIFGHISLHQIRRRNQRGRGMAIAGLVLGYLVIVPVLVAIVARLVIGHPIFTTEAENQKPASQIFQDAVSASSNAPSVHVTGSSATSAGPTTVNMVVSPDCSGGTMFKGGAAIGLVVAHGEVYLRANAAFWQQITSDSSSVQALAGTWIKAPASNSDFSSVTNLTDTDLWKQLEPQGTLTKGPVTTEDGMAVIPLSDSRRDTIVYVADSGPPYIVSVIRSAESPHGSGTLTFDNYGYAAIPSVPTDAVDVSTYLH